jgi:hypothetical protein
MQTGAVVACITSAAVVLYDGIDAIFASDLDAALSLGIA